MAFLAIAILSPFILAKLGFWDSSIASSPSFKPAYEASDNNHFPVSYSTAVERAAPSVVSIHSTKTMPMESHPLFKDPFFRQFFGDPRNPLPQESQPSIGSGVIVTTDGYILTNNHVIAGSDEIKVKLSDGQSALAEVIGTDPESDLAILKIELKNLPSIALGDSDALRVGDVVLAYPGHPLF